MKPKSSAGHMVLEMLYSSLTRIGIDLTPEPDLALGWEPNGEATEFTFHLRPEARFQDGAPVTAGDVVATVKTVLDPDTGSAGRTQLGPIADVIAVDDHTVRFVLQGPYADLPVTLGTVHAKIIPAAVLSNQREALETQPFGSGPFRLTEYDPGRIVRLARNDEYYVPERPYLDAVDQLLYPDSAAEVSALLNRETDLMLEVNPASFSRVAGRDGIVAIRQPAGNFMNLVLRMDTPPFDDARVREALALSLDRQALVDLVLEGYGRPAADSFVSPEYPYAVEQPVPQQDIARADALCRRSAVAAHAARGRGARDGAAGRLRYRGPDHRHGSVSGQCLAQGEFLCRQLEHGCDPGPLAVGADDQLGAVRRRGVEQRGVRRAGDDGAAHRRRGGEGAALWRDPAHDGDGAPVHRAVLPGEAVGALGLCARLQRASADAALFHRQGLARPRRAAPLTGRYRGCVQRPSTSSGRDLMLSGSKLGARETSHA
jgi:hypothetical protein